MKLERTAYCTEVAVCIVRMVMMAVKTQEPERPRFGTDGHIMTLTRRWRENTSIRKQLYILLGTEQRMRNANKIDIR